MQRIKIENLEQNELVSDIMEQAARCVSGESDITEVEKVHVENTKDMGIIISFLVSVTANVFVDALKYAIKRIKARADYNEGCKIKIGDKVYTLHEVEDFEEIK